MLYIKDLEELNNIIDELLLLDENKEEECDYELSDQDENELITLVLEDIDDLMEENIKQMSQPKFHSFIQCEIKNLIRSHLEDILVLMFPHSCDDMIESYVSYIETLAPHIEELYFTTSTIPRRSLGTLEPPTHNLSKEELEKRLGRIYKKDEDNPKQRTKEWFMKRKNMISASTFWKCIDSERCRNSYIYSKCKPLEESEMDSVVNTNSPFHWGVKYEPVSQMYYEKTRNTTIHEFGCINHDVYSFIGASPDGINIKRDSELYGRMVEIKNIVNRKITGIPKKEYWIQTQIQMECCDLEECDFLECRFLEYSGYDAFLADGTFSYTKDNKMKGVIMMFVHENNVYYEYLPLGATEEEYRKWNDDMMVKHAEKEWVQNYYWYLDEVSCVLIPRNRKWFQSIVGDVKNVWDTILREKESGYEHRKPTPRKKTKQKETNKLLLKIDTE